MKLLLILAALLTSLSYLEGKSATYAIYVSPHGNDNQSGQVGAPLKTLEAAQAKSRAYDGGLPIEIVLADGIYYLPDTFVLDSADSGTEQAPVTYRAENEGKAILSGGSLLQLDWKRAPGLPAGVFQATTPEGLEMDQLFVDGHKQRMARYPNFDPAKKTEPYQGYSPDAFSPERAKGWAAPEGGYIHAMHLKRWGGYHFRITGKDKNDAVTYEGGWQNNRQMGMHPDYRMVENIFEELDAPGEWFHDAENSTLYFYPPDTVDLKNARIEVIRLRHLIEMRGTETSPVQHITLQGFVFRHAARTFMDTKEPLLRSDWTIYRGGAVYLNGTESVQVLDSEFDQLGGNAIFVDGYNRDVLIRGCHIHHIGGSAICLIGSVDAVRNPLFEYGERNDLSKIDLTPGPKTNEYPAQSAVEDCLIHDIGTVERQTAGVQIMLASEIAVRDTSIYDTSRAGINIGDGRWGGHLIERVDVFDTVLETHDHGSFNSWGRDRFWRSDYRTVQQAVDANSGLPFLDAMKTTVIRNSRWRCDHGWDVDLDDGSSNYDIYNNLMLNNGLKLREGFRRHVWNNIIINNGVHPHVWFLRSQDKIYSNILMSGYATARMKGDFSEDTFVGRNLYFMDDDSAIKRAEMYGWGKGSLIGNPLFVNPDEGDFRVMVGSPAFDIGFKNFPMDQFGVKKPSLRAIARQPIFPKVASAKQGNPDELYSIDQETIDAGKWQGVEVYDLSGEQYSAFGIGKSEGGAIVGGVRAGSASQKAGLRPYDVIQGINDHHIRSSADFLRVVKIENEPLTLKVIRDQERIELTLLPDTK